MRHYYSRPASESVPGAVLHDLIDNKMAAGDALIPPSVDHLATNWPALKKILEKLEVKNIILKPRHISGNASLPLEQRFKRDLRSAGAFERAGKHRTVRRGRPRSVDRVAIHELREAGLSVDAIVGRLGVSRSIVYEALRTATSVTEPAKSKSEYTSAEREARARSYWADPESATAAALKAAST